MSSSKIVPTELLEDVLDEMIEGFQVIGPDWRYQFVNTTVAKQGKKTKEELLGKTMMEAYPGIDQTPLFQELTRCMKERASARIINEFTFPDGSRGWFELCINPTRDGIVILSVDVSARKMLERELQERIKELNMLTRSAVTREEKMTELREALERLRQLATPTEMTV